MKTVPVKNIRIGEGLPKIAVPVAAADEGAVRRAVRACVPGGADLVELRADAWRGLGDPVYFEEMLRAAGEEAGDLPVLFTLRTAAEGGSFSGTAEAYRDAVSMAAKSPYVSLVDVEFSAEAAEELVRAAHAGHKAVILSHHDFHGTPSFAELVSLFERMEACGCDIAKCACMPQSFADTAVMLAAAAEVKERVSVPVVAISMTDTGQLTRTHGEAVGSAITFGCLEGQASAPGQMEAGVLRAELREVHRCLARGRHLFLTGFMGSGKTAVARALAERTGMRVIEMDEQIASDEGRAIAEIFAENGEEYFRDLETQLLASLAGREACIVSTGGGCVLRAENRALMHALGDVVQLAASPETLFARLVRESEGRPNLRGRMSTEGIRDLLRKRSEAYEAAADHRISTDGLTVEEVAEACLVQLVPR